jgi:hypothetical protein
LATPYRRDFRRRDFFRNNHHRNFSFIFETIPFFVAPYYINYYPTIYYVEPIYILEEPYVSEAIGYLYPSRDQQIYSSYLSENYSENITDAKQQRSLEMQDIENLLQSVLQAMKVFDIPEFYNKPELSIFRSGRLY